MKLNIIAGAIVAFCIAVVAYVKHVGEMSEECKRQGAVLDERERNRKIMEQHMEELSEQLLEFVFDTSKVAELPVDVEFVDVSRNMFWAIHGDDGVPVKVKGLEYEVGEHVVIKGEKQELLLKVLGIDKTDKVNETTTLRCDYVSSREKKDRHSYMDVYDMFYTMQSELDNVKEVVLNQNSMRRHEIEDLEKEMKKGLEHTQKELGKVKETYEHNVLHQTRKDEDILNRVRENYAKLMKDGQDREHWVQEYVDASTSILNDEIKRLYKEVRELRKEVALGVDE